MDSVQQQDLAASLEDQPLNRDRKGNPLAMSFNLKANPNEIPSMHTFLKQQKKMMKFLETIQQQFKQEVDLCLEDQLNLNQGLQGILDYEKAQVADIDAHYSLIWLQLQKIRDEQKEELREKVRKLKERQDTLINLMKNEQQDLSTLETNLYQSIGLNQDALREPMNLQMDLTESIPQLKEHHKKLIEKSKHLRNLRQTSLYQATDYFVFEPPTLEQGLDRGIFEKLKSLKIYGQIKTISPSEFFIASVEDKNGVEKKKIMKVDKNCQANAYSVEFQELQIPCLKDSKENMDFFPQFQAHLWIPEEQKFMFVGGRNKHKQNAPFKSSFLYSVYNPDDIEQLDDLKLRREQCTLCLIRGGTLKTNAMDRSTQFDSKILAIGGYFNPFTGDYQSTCEVLDLQLDVWKANARLRSDRLNPFATQIGRDFALVLGGTQKNHISLDEKLVREVEVVDTKLKRSFFPTSNYKLPEDCKQIFGVFKLSSELKQAHIKPKVQEGQHQGDDPVESIGEETQFDMTLDQIQIDSILDETVMTVQQDEHKQEVDAIYEKLVMVYLDSFHCIQCEFIDCEIALDEAERAAEMLEQSSVHSTKTKRGAMFPSLNLGNASAPSTLVKVKRSRSQSESIFSSINVQINGSPFQKVIQITQSNANPFQFYVVSEPRPDIEQKIAKHFRASTALANPLQEHRLSGSTSWNMLDASGTASLTKKRASFKKIQRGSAQKPLAKPPVQKMKKTTMTLGSIDDFKAMGNPFTPNKSLVKQGEPQTEELKGAGDVSMFTIDGEKEQAAEEERKFVCNSIIIEIPEPMSESEMSVSPKKMSPEKKGLNKTQSVQALRTGGLKLIKDGQLKSKFVQKVNKPLLPSTKPKPAIRNNRQLIKPTVGATKKPIVLKGTMKPSKKTGLLHKTMALERISDEYTPDHSQGEMKDFVNASISEDKKPKIDLGSLIMQNESLRAGPGTSRAPLETIKEQRASLIKKRNSFTSGRDSLPKKEEGLSLFGKLTRNLQGLISSNTTQPKPTVTKQMTKTKSFLEPPRPADPEMENLFENNLRFVKPKDEEVLVSSKVLSEGKQRDVTKQKELPKEEEYRLPIPGNLGQGDYAYPMYQQFEFDNPADQKSDPGDTQEPIRLDKTDDQYSQYSAAPNDDIDLMAVADDSLGKSLKTDKFRTSVAGKKPSLQIQTESPNAAYPKEVECVDLDVPNVELMEEAKEPQPENTRYGQINLDQEYYVGVPPPEPSEEPQIFTQAADGGEAANQNWDYNNGAQNSMRRSFYANYVPQSPAHFKPLQYGVSNPGSDAKEEQPYQMYGGLMGGSGASSKNSNMVGVTPSRLHRQTLRQSRKFTGGGDEHSSQEDGYMARNPSMVQHSEGIVRELEAYIQSQRKK